MSNYHRYAKKVADKASANSVGVPRPNAIDRQGGIGIGAILAVAAVAAVAVGGVVANAVDEENRRNAAASTNQVRSKFLTLNMQRILNVLSTSLKPLMIRLI